MGFAGNPKVLQNARTVQEGIGTVSYDLALFINVGSCATVTAG
jgi:hypothetical protein